MGRPFGHAADRNGRGAFLRRPDGKIGIFLALEEAPHVHTVRSVVATPFGLTSNVGPIKYEGYVGHL